MPTVGPLYATTASGHGTAANATGAPNGTEATVGTSTPLTVGGFGIQSAIGSQPASIDAVRVTVRARSATFAATITSGNYSTSIDLPPAALDNLTVTLPARTWADLANLEATITRGDTNAFVDAVWVEVDYTTAIPATPTPIAGEGKTSLTATSLHAVALPIVGEGATNLVVSYLPSGFVTLPIVGEGATSLTATNLHAAALPVVGEGTVTATVTNWHVIGLAPIVGEGRVRVDAHRLVPTIVRRPPRTIDELVAGSHRREDHVTILTGPRAGERLPLVGGDLLLDEAADVHATGRLDLPPEAWLADYLDPLATRTELAVVLAIRGDDGTRHDFQRAIVHATSMPIDVSADGGLALSVEVADRSDWVSKRGMREPYAGSGSETIMTHVLRLVALHAPWLPIGAVHDPGYRSGGDLLVGDLGEDPWRHAVQLAWSVGLRLYVDALGRLATRPVLTTSTAAARWVAGEADCLVSDMGTSRSDADVCNTLGVRWEEAKPEDAGEDWVPRAGVEWWVDTTSPLSIHSELGERVRAYAGDHSVIHNAAHALDVAVSHGLAQQGVAAPLDFAVACDPRRDVGDTIHVVRPELDVDELCRITTLRFGLGQPLMSGSMGARRIT